MTDIEKTGIQQDIQARTVECAHCAGTGVCKNGKDGESCAVCIKKGEVKGDQLYGVVCGVCGGTGRAELFTDRMNNRIVPFLAILIVYAALFLIYFAAWRDTHFTEILAFGGTLIGSITGYYFSSKKQN